MPALKKTPTQELIARSQACFDRYSRLNGIDVGRIAKLMNVTEKTVYNWINHPESVSMEKMWRLATILKCPVGELCGGELPEETIGRWIKMSMVEVR